MNQNRIPFNVSLRPEIEAGKYRVETRDGRPVEILKSDMPEPLPLLVLYDGNDVERVSKYGIYNLGHQGMNDLFLVPVEPEPDEVRGGETLRWSKGDNTLQEGGLYLIRTREGSADGGFIYYVEWRESLSDYEEYIPIEKLEKLTTK